MHHYGVPLHQHPLYPNVELTRQQSEKDEDEEVGDQLQLEHDGVDAAEDLDATLTEAMRAAYAAQRAEIGPLGYDDRIYRRKKMATPAVHALTAEAEHLLTLRETHRLTGIPAVTYDPAR